MAFHLIILLSDPSLIMSLSCLVTQSAPFVKVAKPNEAQVCTIFVKVVAHIYNTFFCKSCYIYLSVLTWTYRPLANPTKLKFDQEFDLFWSSNLIKAPNVRVHCAFGTLFRVDMCNNRMSWGPVNSSLFCQWPPCWYCPYYPVARYQFEHQTQLNSNYRFCVGWYPKSPKN